jgi:hypothetical protein
MQGSGERYGHLRQPQDDCGTRTLTEPTMTHSTREVTQRPHSLEFSAHPRWHYFLSLSITLLLFESIFWCDDIILVAYIERADL